jgi:enoyl-CoA hydratase/carnithine racemase
LNRLHDTGRTSGGKRENKRGTIEEKEDPGMGEPIAEKPVLLVEKKDRVTILTMNRPERKNALNEALVSAIIHAVKEAEDDPETGAILLYGGDTFCSGGDIGDFSRAMTKNAPDHYAEGQASNRLFRLGREARKPIIAAVRGAALGGGCGLVAMAHIAVAGETAKLGTPEVKIGMFPFVIYPLIVAAVGQKRAWEMALTGRTLSAAEAAEWGLVNRVVPDDTVFAEALQMARQAASLSPLIVKLGLMAANTTRDMPFDESLEYLQTLRIVSLMSEDLREGAMAFLEKRAPQWKGR